MSLVKAKLFSLWFCGQQVTPSLEKVLLAQARVFHNSLSILIRFFVCFVAVFIISEGLFSLIGSEM